MKEKIYVGTINPNELFMKRKGKLNSLEFPNLKTKVHKSKKDYSRQRDKKVKSEEWE